MTEARKLLERTRLHLNATIADADRQKVSLPNIRLALDDIDAYLAQPMTTCEEEPMSGRNKRIEKLAKPTPEEAEIANLQAALKTAEEEIAALRGVAALWADHDAVLQAREGELVAALEPYVAHASGCGYGSSRYRQADGCDCGLTEARAALAQGKKA